MTLRKLAGETAIYGFSYILSRVLHYVLFTWYLTRVFNDDPAQYGIYRDLYFYVAVIVVLLTFRMETTFFRYAKENRPTVTAMALFFLSSLGIIFIAVLWLLRFDIAQALSYPNMSKHISMLGVIIFFDILSSVPFSSLRQQNRPFKFLFLKLGSIVLNIGFVLFFIEMLPVLADRHLFWNSIYTGDKLFYVILGNLIASSITFLMLIPVLKKQPLNWDLNFLKRMLRYAWPLVIVGFAGVINQYSSVTFQKYLLSDNLAANLEEGGKYAAAASLAIILSLFTTAYNYAAEPFFFANKDHHEAGRVYADAALAYTIVASFMMLVILAYIDLFQLLLGANFREGLEVVPILLVSFVFLGIYYNVSAWYKLADKTLWGAWIAGTGTVITIVLSFLLIRSMGVIGSAWTALACYVFMVVSCYLLGQKFYPIPYRIWRMLGWILTALFIYFIMENLRNYYESNIIMILSVNTFFVLLYIASVILIEKSLIRQISMKV